jgi:PST family polysaccharide transporter
MLKFGGHLTGFNFVNYFARNADNILIGRFIGAEALGIYGRAYQLLMLPITMMSGPLSGVAVPALCRLNEDRARLHKYYLHILYMLSLVAGPIAGISFLASKDIIMILLGPTWSSVGDVFKYLAIGALLQPLYNTQAWLHIATGKTERVLIWGFIGTPLIVISFFIGILWGIKGVALCYSIAIILTTYFSLWYAGRSANLQIKKIIQHIFPPIMSCIFATLLSELFFLYTSYSLIPIISVSIKFIIFIVLYLFLLTIFYRGFKPIKDVIIISEIMKLKQ